MKMACSLPPLFIVAICMLTVSACASATPARGTPAAHTEVASRDSNAVLPSAATTQSVPDLAAQIAAQNEAMEAAFRRGDMPGVASFYADDAIMLAPGGGRYSGRAEIDAYWLKFNDPVDWQLDVRRVEGGASLAVQRGRSTLVYRRDGEEKTSVVEFMLVWIRTGEQWQISVDAYWN